MLKNQRASFHAVAIAVLAATTLLSGSAAASDYSYSDQDEAVFLTNDVRAWEGVAPLAWDDSLAAIAQDWAEQLRDAGAIAHNSSLQRQMWDWWAWGENVGRGPSVALVHNALVNSYSHYANLADPDFTYIGIGVAYDAMGRVYLVEVFGG